MGCIILARYVPTSIWLLRSDSPLATIFDNIAGDLFSLSIVTLWIVKFGLTKPATRLWVMMGPACAAVIVADSYYRTSLEMRNVWSFQQDPAGDLEYIVTWVNIGILIFCYFTYVLQGTRIPARPDRRLDMATYSLFIAKISQIADDLISRARFLNCTEICLDMRMFAEIAFLVLFELKWGWEGDFPGELEVRQEKNLASS
jgi:hypothetical protein